MKAQGFCRSAPRFFQSSTSRNAPRKIWEAHAKIRFTILVQICDVIHQSAQPNACLLFDASQRANRYISNGCGTVTRPVFTGCLNCLWLPTCATSYQPSCFKRCMTSRLDIRYDTHFLHTCQVGVYKSVMGAYVEDGKGIAGRNRSNSLPEPGSLRSTFDFPLRSRSC